MSNNTNSYLQYLRAISCIGVVIFHATLLFNYTYSQGYIFTAGKYFVGIFFVLSGYLVERNHNNESFNKYKFLKRRFNRIYPLYSIFTILAAFGYFLKYGNIDVANLLKSIALHSRLSNSTPVLYVGWSVEIECLFYVLFAFMSSSPIFLLALGWTGSIIFNEIVGTALLQIVCGMLLFKIGRLRQFLWNMTFIINMVFIYALGVTAEIFVTIFAVAYIYFAENACARVKSNLLSVVGDASFSIYLIQVFTLPIILKFWNMMDASKDLFVVVSTSMTIGVGMLTYKYLEMPILRRVK